MYPRPAPQPIRTFTDAERVARDWMRYLGFPDAEVTRSGPDTGIDVEAPDAVAQVKTQTVPVGRPLVQAIVGAAAAEKKRALFFTFAGYTQEAVEWASKAGAALFVFNYQGEVEPSNGDAHEMLTAATLRASPPTFSINGSAFACSAEPPESLWAMGYYFHAVTELNVELGTELLDAGLELVTDALTSEEARREFQSILCARDPVAPWRLLFDVAAYVMHEYSGYLDMEALHQALKRDYGAAYKQRVRAETLKSVRETMEADGYKPRVVDELVKIAEENLDYRERLEESLRGWEEDDSAPGASRET